MGISTKTIILEYYFLYHLVSETERKLTHTKEEIVDGVFKRYHWAWDDDFEIALELLKTERVSRSQPGLLKDSKTGTFSWHAAFREGETHWTSNFFTASEIQSWYEVLRKDTSIGIEQIYSDAVYAYEKLFEESFQEGIEREEREYEQKHRGPIVKREGTEDPDIPF
jgi:hypothetical protein